MEVECEKILFQKDLDICADEFKKFKLLSCVWKICKCELAIAARLKVAEVLIENSYSASALNYTIESFEVYFHKLSEDLQNKKNEGGTSWE